MDIREHFYPAPDLSLPDAHTNRPGCSYFFLGNGLLQAAVQFSTSPDSGAPLGLLLMHPELFGKKSDALTFHPESGLEATMATVAVDNRDYTPAYGATEVRWQLLGEVPTVVATWQAKDCVVREEFWCPSSEPILFRRLIVENGSPRKIEGKIRLRFLCNPNRLPARRVVPAAQALIAEGLTRLHLQALTPASVLRDCLVVSFKDLAPEERFVAPFAYTLGEPHGQVPEMDTLREHTRRYWREITCIRTGDEGLDHLFAMATVGLRAAVARSGRMDASIWQYNREWVRDGSMVAWGALLAGHLAVARGILENLLLNFTSERGDTIDSSEWRSPAEVELDQNGQLLYVLWMYWAWTGDDALIRKFWPRIKALAEFPLQSVFWDPESRLLKNTREYWERHAFYGVREGYELAHQLWVVLGLQKAAEMADRLHERNPAGRWRAAEKTIREAMLSHPRFAMIEEGHFIKRRLASGEVQRTLVPQDRSLIPPGVPLALDELNELEPDASEALPIAFELIPPTSPVARATLNHLEALWNQRWEGGGYGRYNVTSEPDSPGPWPFPTMFITRAYLEAGDHEKVWRNLRWLLACPGGRAGAWFEFYGSRPVPPLPQVGIISWAWAELAIFFVHHLLGVRPNLDELLLRPRLLSGLDSVTARVPLRGDFLDLTLKRSSGPWRAIRDDEAPIQVKDGRVRLPLPLDGHRRLVIEVGPSPDT